MEFSYLTNCVQIFAGLGFQALIHGWRNNDQYPITREILSKGHSILAASVLGLFIAEKLEIVPPAINLVENSKPVVDAIKNGCITTTVGRVIGQILLNLPEWIDRKYIGKD